MNSDALNLSKKAAADDDGDATADPDEDAETFTPRAAALTPAKKPAAAKKPAPAKASAAKSGAAATAPKAAKAAKPVGTTVSTSQALLQQTQTEVIAHIGTAIAPIVKSIELLVSENKQLLRETAKGTQGFQSELASTLAKAVSDTLKQCNAEWKSRSDDAAAEAKKNLQTYVASAKKSLKTIAQEGLDAMAKAQADASAEAEPAAEAEVDVLSE